LNIGGQRGRSTLVQVDGADFTDNSINAARSTVSQEAVQEYQVSTQGYTAEFGRATGGIVNVVTKSGTNVYNGNVFGFIRDKSVQARNPFAPVIDGDPDKRPPVYARSSTARRLADHLLRNGMFFFASFEQRRRQESGFFTGDIVGGGTSSVTIPVIPGLNPIAVRRHHHFGLAVANAIGHRLGAEPAENHGVDRADARAGQHGDGRLRYHGQIDDDPIALLDAVSFENVGESTDLAMQLAIGQHAFFPRAAVPGRFTFPHQGRLVGGGSIQPLNPGN
jgi:hypothetical protein